MGATQCIKYTMFVFNLLFFLMGCGILGLGIWLKVEKGDYAEISSEYNFLTAANICIGAGAIILIIAFFGCLGAIKEIPSLLLAFFVCLLIIFALEIAAGGIAYAKRGDIEDELSKEFKNAIKNEYFKDNDTDSGVYKAINLFQEDFKCCGFDNFTDWQNSVYNRNTGSIPASCCIDQKNALCQKSTPSALANYYKIGCFEEVKEFLKDNLLLIGGFAIAFAVIQILGMVFAMYLYCAFRDGKGTLA